MKEKDFATKYLESDIKMVEEFSTAMKDLNNTIDSCIKTTDWLIRGIPKWKLLKEKEIARFCNYFKISFAKSKFTEKEWAKMLDIKKRTVHKLLHDPVPEMNIETYFKLRYYFRFHEWFYNKRKEDKNENS